MDPKTPEQIEAERQAEAAKPVVVIVAKRPMARAGRRWAAGETPLTAAELGELGDDKMKAIAADPNFTIVQANARSVRATVGEETKTITAHTVVVAKRPMWRVGRHWAEGVTPLKAAEVVELGPEKIATLKADPNFTVTQNETAAEAQAEAEAAAEAEKAAEDARKAEEAKAAASAPAPTPDATPPATPSA